MQTRTEMGITRGEREPLDFANTSSYNAQNAGTASETTEIDGNH